MSSTKSELVQVGWLWRAKDYAGRVGAWTACLGFKPCGSYGGNEYRPLYAPLEPTEVEGDEQRPVQDPT